jgi:hypothetical protein
MWRGAPDVMPDLRWWQWALIAWPIVSFAVAVPLGKLLKRSREQMEAEEEFWKAQQRRSASRWN